MLSSFIYRNCLLRVVAVGQSDSPESSHPLAVRKLHAVRCPCTSRKCRFSRQMKVISVVSDIWSQSFYSTEASFQFNSKIYRSHVTEAWVRENSEVNPKLISGLMKQKSCPRIGIPDPSRTKHAARHRSWMKIGVCVICHMELRFGLHRTGSRKLYSMNDLIDDSNAMIARRPCHGSWILRVWSVNRVSRFRSVSSPVSVKGGLRSIG